MQRFSEKVCVVTGAARGICREVSARFRDEGAEVVVTDRDDNAGVATAVEIGARFVRLDVAEDGQTPHNPNMRRWRIGAPSA